MRRPHLRAIGVVIGIATVPVLVAAGCDAPSGEASSPQPTVVLDHSLHVSSAEDTHGLPKVECAMHMPGELLTEAEAMVIFDREHVCLGYVTVKPGTKIMFHNTDADAQTVTILDEDDKELESFEVEPEGSGSLRLNKVGVYHYRTTAIESFVGSIEVTRRSTAG